MPSSNLQKYVVMVTAESGMTWPVGTNTQRGFTKAGAIIALSKARETLPKGWSCRVEEVSSLNYLLESVTHLRKKK